MDPLTAPIDLRTIVNQTPKTIWVPFRDTGIRFEIVFMSKTRFKVLSEKCVSLVYDNTTRTHVQRIDTKKIATMFVGEAVKNWSGVTPKSLGSILPVNLSNLTDAQASSEIPFSVEQLAFLVENAFDLDTFFQEASMNPALFNQLVVPMEAAVKNSVSS